MLIFAVAVLDYWMTSRAGLEDPSGHNMIWTSCIWVRIYIYISKLYCFILNWEIHFLEK